MTTSTALLTILVNDRPHAVAPNASVQDLLLDLGLADRRGIAVAINDEVVPRSSWADRTLAASDRVLLIQATQGG